MAKQMNCPKCFQYGETVAMNVKNKSHFECPECNGEFYDNPNGDNSFILKWQQQQMHISRSFQPGTHVQGGGDTVGKAKKESMKKKSVGALRHSLDEPRFY